MPILFSFAEPRLLVLAVLCSSITVYFLALSQKPRELWFLIGAFSSWTFYFLFAICADGASSLALWFSVVELFFGLAGVFMFVGFSYQFREDPYPREFRVTMTIAAILVIFL